MRSQYAYTLKVGQCFRLPGEDVLRTVEDLVGGPAAVERRVVDDKGGTHDPGTVVERDLAVEEWRERHPGWRCPECGADRGDGYCQECGGDRE